MLRLHCRLWRSLCRSTILENSPSISCQGVSRIPCISSLVRPCSSGINVTGVTQAPAPDDAPYTTTTTTSPDPDMEKCSLASLLHMARQEPMYISRAAEIVGNLAVLKRAGDIEEKDFINNPGFLAVMTALESGNQKMSPLAAISCLKALADLGLSDNSFVVKNLENKLTWAARSCPIKELVMMLSFSIGRKRTEEQKVLFSEVLQSLERRWVEIKGASALVVQAAPDNFWVLLNKEHFNKQITKSGTNTRMPILLTDITDAKIFAGLLHYSEQFTPQFLAKLEDRIADLVENFMPSELVTILKTMAFKKRRNVPLLKSIAFYITKHRSLLDVKQLTDCLFAMNKLSFKDIVVLERICSELEGRLVGVNNAALMRSLLISLGQLRFYSPDLLDRVCDWYEAQEVLEDRDLSSLLVTLANLNYRPPRNRALLQRIANRLEPDLFKDHKRFEVFWLDLVWSLVVLDLASNAHLESVLNSGFYNSLLYSNDNKNLGTTLKLLNVNAAASKIYTDYKGPVLNIAEDALLRDVKVSSSLSKVQFCQTVLEAFANIAPPPRFLSLNVNTLLGCQAEGDMVCDAEGHPLLVCDYTNTFESSTPLTPLPPGATRVALVVASFQDCLISGSQISGSLAGVTALNVRLIEAAGYKVLLVKYTDLEGMKLVARVKRLETMLRTTLGLTSDSTTTSPTSLSQTPLLSTTTMTDSPPPSSLS